MAFRSEGPLEAIEQYDDFLNEFGRDPIRDPMGSWRVIYYHYAGRFTEAAILAEKNIEESGTSPAAYMWVMLLSAISETHLGNTKQALSKCAVAQAQWDSLVVEDQLPNYNCRMIGTWAYHSVMIFVRADSLNIAERELKRMGDCLNEEPLGYNAKALILESRGENEQALSLLRQALTAFSKDVENWYWHVETATIAARILLKQDQPAEAAGYLEQALRRCTGYAEAHYELGRCYEQLGRVDAAASEYEIFLEMWSQADEGLPLLEDARKRLAALQTTQ